MAEMLCVVRAGLRASYLIACIAGLAFSFSPDAQARVTKMVLNPPTHPYGTATFGKVGQYEQLDGVASGEIDPQERLNAVIQDIDLAPRNSRGMVEYSTKVSSLRPVT